MADTTRAAVAPQPAPKRPKVKAPEAKKPEADSLKFEVPPADPTLRLKAVVADSASMQGRRPTQEDRNVKIPDLTKAAKALKMPIGHLEQPCAFFAVYDGHRGHVCVDFVAKSFHMKLLRKLSATGDRAYWTAERIGETLREVCRDVDAEFLAKYRTALDGPGRATPEPCSATSGRQKTPSARCGLRTITGRVAKLRPSASSGLAARSLTSTDPCVLRTPASRILKERVREIRRAEQQGLGLIGKEPVALAVSRSLGDRDFKACTGKDVLTANPDVRCWRLDRSHKFVAIMCDGITDVMSDDEVVFDLAFVRNDNDVAADAKAACASLVQEAYKRGSQDNMTVVLARFQWEDVKPPASNGAVGAKATSKKVASNCVAGESAVAALKRRHHEQAAEALQKAPKVDHFVEATNEQAL